MLFSKAAVLAFVGAASAVPSESLEARHAKGFSRHVITFDGLTAVPAAPELTPLTTVQGLKFTSFDLLAAGVPGVATVGVQPQSGENVAVFSIDGGGLMNGAAFSRGAGIKSFGLESLYFGCVVNSAESAAGVATPCTVAFTGYKIGQTKPVKTLNFQFNAPNPAKAPMRQAVFPINYNELQRVEIAVVSSATTSATTSLLIDTIKATECTTN